MESKPQGQGHRACLINSEPLFRLEFYPETVNIVVSVQVIASQDPAAVRQKSMNRSKPPPLVPSFLPPGEILLVDPSQFNLRHDLAKGYFVDESFRTDKSLQSIEVLAEVPSDVNHEQAERFRAMKYRDVKADLNAPDPKDNAKNFLNIFMKTQVFIIDISRFRKSHTLPNEDFLSSDARQEEEQKGIFEDILSIHPLKSLHECNIIVNETVLRIPHKSYSHDSILKSYNNNHNNPQKNYKNLRRRTLRSMALHLPNNRSNIYVKSAYQYNTNDPRTSLDIYTLANIGYDEITFDSGHESDQELLEEELRERLMIIDLLPLGVAVRGKVYSDPVSRHVKTPSISMVRSRDEFRIRIADIAAGYAYDLYTNSKIDKLKSSFRSVMINGRHL